MRPLVIAVLVLSTSICARPALAQTGWTGVVTTVSAPMESEGSFAFPRIAADANGNAYAVWTQFQGLGNALIQMARYTLATDTWSAPTTLAGPGEFSFPDVAVDGLGNGFFTITSPTGAVDVVRFVPSSGELSTTTLSSNAAGGDDAQVVAGATGDAIVVWTEPIGLRSARYSAATDTWTGPIAAPGHSVSDFEVEVDNAGNLTAVWWSQEVVSGTFRVQAARLDVGSPVWSPAVTLSLPAQLGGFASGIALAIDPAGNATAAWASNADGTGMIIQAARFLASTGTWSSATPISTPGGSASVPHASADSAGNVALVWHRLTGTTFPAFVQAAVFSAATGSWSTPVNLSSPLGLGSSVPKVKFDALGNAIVVWGRSLPGGSARIEGARFTAATNTLSITALSTAGQMALNPDLEFDAFGNATVVWFEITPPLIGGVAIIHSTGWAETPRPAPNPPSDLIVSSVSDNTVTLAWTAAGTGLDPTGYVVEGGIAPGEVLASIPTGSAATTFTFDAPSGVFVARVHAVRGLARSAASNEVRLVVNAPQPPSAPRALLGLVNGSTLALSWTNTFDGGAPTSVQLNVTGALTATAPLGMAEAFTFSGVPAGTYTFTVAASNASGVSPPSNPVTLTFRGDTCSASPGVPTHFNILTDGRMLDLSWMPPVSGGAVTGYSLLVSGAFVGSVPTSARSLSGTVAPGTYTLSVVATNPCGTSPPTPAQTVTLR